MAGDERVNFFTAEAEARAMRRLGVPLWTSQGAVAQGRLSLLVTICPGGPVRQMLIEVPDKIRRCDADAEYDAFIGKVACLL